MTIPPTSARLAGTAPSPSSSAARTSLGSADLSARGVVAPLGPSSRAERSAEPMAHPTDEAFYTGVFVMTAEHIERIWHSGEAEEPDDYHRQRDIEIADSYR